MKMGKIAFIAQDRDPSAVLVSFANFVARLVTLSRVALGREAIIAVQVIPIAASSVVRRVINLGRKITTKDKIIHLNRYTIFSILFEFCNQFLWRVSSEGDLTIIQNRDSVFRNLDKNWVAQRCRKFQ